MLTALLSLSLAAETNTARMYISGRASAGYPAGYAGVANSFGVEIGGVMRDRNALGIRFLALPQPPEIYGSDTPDLAFGPTFNWAYMAPVGSRFDIYPTVALGFAVGPSPIDRTNMMLPVLQGGLGARVHLGNQSGNELYIAPELGIAPLLLAPYMAINVGGLFSPDR